MQRSILLTAALAQGVLCAQLSPTATWAAHGANEYQVLPNITYLTANNYDAKLDIYKRRDAPGAQPTLIYIHAAAGSAAPRRRR